MKTRYLTAAETAKLVRAALKADFPGVVFKVRSSTYANGAAVDGWWTEGPTDHAVRASVDRYQGADFDGMIDLKIDRPDSLVEVNGVRQVVSFGADYVMTHRSYSEAAKLNAALQFERRRGVEYDPDHNYTPDGGTADWGQHILWRDYLAPVDLR